MERPGSITSVSPSDLTMSRTVSMRSVGVGSLVSGLRGVGWVLVLGGLVVGWFWGGVGLVLGLVLVMGWL